MQAPETEQARNELPENLLAWTRQALPEDMEPAAHHKALLKYLEDLDHGDFDRLMVLMPPGSAKSTYTSVIFPPWFLARHPRSSIIACSHTFALASHFGSRVRELVTEHGDSLGCRLKNRRARHEFTLDTGGGYFAVGVHGAVTGRRADLILIDDPVRSYFEAESHSARERLWDWYRADLLTRLKPKGRIIIIMTRWHRDDLVGKLLTREPSWKCLKLPALAEVEDPIGRAEGEALWPEWESVEDLERKKMLIGGTSWAALYQQQPVSSTGREFDISKMTVTDRADPMQCIRAWDLASTPANSGQKGDWTAGIKLGREASGRFVIMDVVRLKASAYQVEAEIARTARGDGRHVIIGLPQDPGQAAKRQVQYLTSDLVGYDVRSSTESGSKKTRARPLASQIEAGNVVMLRADWNTTLLDELEEFPNGDHDDQVDALSRAINEMYSMERPGFRKTLNFIGR